MDTYNSKNRRKHVFSTRRAYSMHRCTSHENLPPVVLFNIYHKNAQDKLMEEKV